MVQGGGVGAASALGLLGVWLGGCLGLAYGVGLWAYGVGD